MFRRSALLALAFAVAPRLAPAQAPDLTSIVDEGLAELARRQMPNGSYANDVQTTAAALVALCESDRKYTESDGPFVRKAVAWLASQIGNDGRPAGVADNDAAVGLARWSVAALRLAKSDAAKAAVQRLEGFLDSPPAHLPADKVPADHLWTITVTAGADAAQAATNVAGFLSPLVSGRNLDPKSFDRQLEALPALLEDVAKRFPTLELQTTAGGPKPWAEVVRSTVLASMQAPGGFEEASPHNLAAGARALTICAQNLKQGGGGPPKVAPPAGTPRTVGSDLDKSYREAAGAGLQYLAKQQKDGRFGFMGHDDPGITALALDAAVRTQKRLGEPRPAWIDAGLDYLVSLQKKNGAIYSGAVAVYTTSAAVMALTDAGREKDKDAIARATDFLKIVQLDEKQGYDKDKDWGYGGIGYDGNELRPDLSNTQFGMDAMHHAGVPASDEAMQRALIFLQRCQNNPEFNPTLVEREDGQRVRSGTDGGSGYAPGESKAGLIDNGDGTFTSRSYGSMTYALLKCYLFAGLKMDDPRVQSALRWIERNWSVDVNPGFDPKESPGAQYQGLFYYWFTMAKALDAAGVKTLKTPDGVEHDWREELLRKLVSTSMNEGFWTNNKSARWMEEFPVLASSYALVAMDFCRPPASSPK